MRDLFWDRDAFYYKKRPEGFDKLFLAAGVVIQDNVDIGALCTVDRGVTGDTLIKKGTKLDNQCSKARYGNW